MSSGIISLKEYEKLSHLEQLPYASQCSGCGEMGSMSEVGDLKKHFSQPCSCGGHHQITHHDFWKPAYMFQEDNVCECPRCNLLSPVPEDFTTTFCSCGKKHRIISAKYISKIDRKESVGVIQCSKCHNLWSLDKFREELVKNPCACGGTLELIPFRPYPREQ